MKIAVIGAGIEGLCTAYELATLGHGVQVFDRNSSAAEATSFANGSLMSALTTGSVLQQISAGALLRSKFKQSTPLHWRGFSPSLLRWAHQTRKLRRSPVGSSRRKDLHELMQNSRQHLTAVCNTLRIDIDQSEGVMLLMRDAQERQHWSALLHELSEWGAEFSTLDTQQAHDLEPALRDDTALNQAVLLREDTSANCRQFGLLLKTHAEEMGVQFHFNAEVLPFAKNTAIHTVRTRQQDHKGFEAVVVCAGEGAMRLLHPLGIRPLVQYVHGYSVSAAVREPLDAPKSAVFDTQNHVSIARLGQRVRVAGAFTVGQHLGLEPRRLELLYKVLDDWFPGAARTHENPQLWHSTVACTVDGLPLLGKTSVSGLWLNTAHGLSGWAVACGCARMVAEQISGRASALAPEKFSIDRFLK